MKFKLDLATDNATFHRDACPDTEGVFYLGWIYKRDAEGIAKPFGISLEVR